MISEFPLMLFTVLTGIAAGAYVAAAAFPKKGSDEKAWLFPLCALILAVLGGLAATGHLGRIENIFYVLNNPGSSIAMEGLCTGALALVALVDLILCKQKGEANRVVRIVGAVVGLVFMCIVTSVYVKSYGNPAWMAAPTYGIFVLGALAAGFGAYKLFADEDAKALDTAAAVCNLLFAAVLAWQAVTFSGMEVAGVLPLAAGAILAIAAAAAAFKLKGTSGAYAVALLAVLALLVSRYGFYMASII